jgi:hypothetical protein
MIKQIEGEYYLQGVREMASGFLFKPDGNFQFFFIYGALDRYGSGKWAVNGDRVMLNSLPKPVSDFALVESTIQSHDFINIKMQEANPVLLRYVFCSLQNGAEGSWKQMSQQGEVQFPKQEVASVSLLLEFCSERFSTIPIQNKDHNEFIFRFEPSVMEVFFDNFHLQMNEDGLFGGHPLMQGEEFSYAKQ